MKWEHFGVPTITLDIPMVNGYSGSPVVDKVSGEVMGVVFGLFTAHQEAGFTVAYRLTSEDIAGSPAGLSGAAEGMPKAKTALEEKPRSPSVNFSN